MPELAQAGVSPAQRSLCKCSLMLSCGLKQNQVRPESKSRSSRVLDPQAFPYFFLILTDGALGIAPRGEVLAIVPRPEGTDTGRGGKVTSRHTGPGGCRMQMWAHDGALRCKDPSSTHPEGSRCWEQTRGDPRAGALPATGPPLPEARRPTYSEQELLMQ